MNLSSNAGSYTALAAVIVIILAKFDIDASADTVLTIIAGIIGLVGIVRQIFVHKALTAAAQSAGVIPKFPR